MRVDQLVGPFFIPAQGRASIAFGYTRGAPRPLLVAHATYLHTRERSGSRPQRPPGRGTSALIHERAQSFGGWRSPWRSPYSMATINNKAANGGKSPSRGPQSPGGGNAATSGPWAAPPPGRNEPGPSPAGRGPRPAGRGGGGGTRGGRQGGNSEPGDGPSPAHPRRAGRRAPKGERRPPRPRGPERSQASGARGRSRGRAHARRRGPTGGAHAGARRSARAPTRPSQRARPSAASGAPKGQAKPEGPGRKPPQAGERRGPRGARRARSTANVRAGLRPGQPGTGEGRVGPEHRGGKAKRGPEPPGARNRGPSGVGPQAHERRRSPASWAKPSRAAKRPPLQIVGAFALGGYYDPPPGVTCDK